MYFIHLLSRFTDEIAATLSWSFGRYFLRSVYMLRVGVVVVIQEYKAHTELSTGS